MAANERIEWGRNGLKEPPTLARTLYRVFTETKPGLAELVSKRFDGFTLVPATGYWLGEPEQSTVIEIVTDDGWSVFELAEDIKEVNGQDAVLVERIRNASWLL